VLGLGSTGVHGNHREGDNQFAVLDFEDVTNVHMTTFEIGPTNTRVGDEKESFVMPPPRIL
jgi:hypothetical protein